MNHNEKKALIVNYLKESNSNKFTYWNHLYSFSTENLTDYFTKELFTNKIFTNYYYYCFYVFQNKTSQKIFNLY